MSGPFEELQRFLRELKRRKVYRVAAAYVAVAFVALEAVDILVPATTLPGWASPFLVAVLIVGFPVAVVLAWAFELTPEGVRRTSAPDVAEEGKTARESSAGARSADAGPPRAAYGVLVGLGLLAAAVAGIWYLTGGGRTPEITDRSLAVLPFETLGSEEATAFTDGVQTGLVTRLSNVSDLVVKSRTSVMRYRGAETALPEIARELGASWVVRGEVQEAAGQVRVSVRLVNAREDRQVWGESYQRRLTAENLFAVQEEITKRVAEELQARLTPGEQRRVEARPTESLDAYRLYVRGRSLLDQRTEVGMRQGARLFERAIARDSGYALAWSGLADALSLLWFYGYAPADSVSSVSLRAARRAVEADSGSGEAHASLGIVRSLRREGPAALRELRRAVELQPSYGEAHAWLSWVHLMVGRPEGAVEPGRTAVELDPLAPAYRAYLAEALLANGGADSALAEARRAREIQPEYGLAHYMEGLVLHHLRRHAEADEALRRSLSLVPPRGTPSHAEIRAARAATLAASGDTAGARALLEPIDVASAPFSAGLAHAALGEREETFAAFRRVVDWGSFETEQARYFFPEVLGPLREDPRYEELVGTIDRAWGLESGR